jgi:phosphatidylglycerol:prolipoprotein diacylglycerol transferase
MGLNYIIWSGTPEIFTFGSFSLRWYGLLFALGFLISQQILYYVFKAEKKPQKDVDTLTIYMVIATILGARLGHILFYDIDMLWSNPLGVILPFEFNPFRFTGLQGLASHGAAIGILFALWLYARKKKPGQSYFQIVDRIVIVVALTGALIRLGNYFNSEIIGKPTDSPWAVTFAGKLTDYLVSPHIDRNGIVDHITYTKNEGITSPRVGHHPIDVYVFFKKSATEEQVERFVSMDVNNVIAQRLNEFFDTRVYDTFISNPNNEGYVGKITTLGITRHPAQLYESIACIILFLVLFAIWNSYKENLPAGRLLGIFLIWCFGLRFFFEFLKENQVSFEDTLPINMGQILSIPFVILGIIILYLSTKKKA